MWRGHCGSHWELTHTAALYAALWRRIIVARNKEQITRKQSIACFFLYYHIIIFPFKLRLPLVFLPAHLYSYLLVSSRIFVSGAALPHYCCFPFSFSRVLPKELPSPILLWPRALWATQIMKGKTQFVFWTMSVTREEKRRKGEDGREGEGGRGLLKSQFEE